VFTVGHSTRSVDEFVELLRGHGVGQVADVRTIARSRHNPQFNEDALERSLSREEIGYIHMKALGGFRHALKDSPNDGWRNASFRGFADYMATAEFREGLEELKTIAELRHTAIMCAEAVPWRCHRSLIADALLSRGWPVRDILSPTDAPAHRLTPFARVERGQLTYPAPPM
jgi:uncharacterized protein (DUF488 family)